MEVNSEMNLYDINKQAMKLKKPMSEEDLWTDIFSIATWMFEDSSRYFMLLCHEERDYTLFHFLDSRAHHPVVASELGEVFENRGQVLDIYYEEAENAFAIWIRVEDENFLYHLFPYEAGVIEI